MFSLKLFSVECKCKYKESLFFLIKFGFQIFNLFASGHVVREVAELFVVVEDELEAADLKQHFDKFYKNAKKRITRQSVWLKTTIIPLRWRNMTHSKRKIILK
jgi:hypothetical protein